MAAQPEDQDLPLRRVTAMRPPEALRPASGTVEASAVVILTVDEAGEITECEIRKASHPELHESIKASLKHWKFEPASAASAQRVQTLNLRWEINSNSYIVWLSDYEVDKPRLLDSPINRVPDSIYHRNITGNVHADVLVGKDGKVLESTGVDEPGAAPTLVSLFRESTLRWKYQPANVNGRPVEYVVREGFTFGPSRPRPGHAVVRQGLYGGLTLSKEFQDLPDKNWAIVRVEVKPRGGAKSATLVASSDPKLGEYLTGKLRKADFLPHEVDGKWVEQEGLIVCVTFGRKVFTKFPYEGDENTVESLIWHYESLMREEVAKQ